MSRNVLNSMKLIKFLAFNFEGNSNNREGWNFFLHICEIGTKFYLGFIGETGDFCLFKKKSTLILFMGYFRKIFVK